MYKGSEYSLGSGDVSANACTGTGQAPRRCTSKIRLSKGLTGEATAAAAAITRQQTQAGVARKRNSRGCELEMACRRKPRQFLRKGNSEILGNPRFLQVETEDRWRCDMHRASPESSENVHEMGMHMTLMDAYAGVHRRTNTQQVCVGAEWCEFSCAAAESNS